MKCKAKWEIRIFPQIRLSMTAGGNISFKKGCKKHRKMFVQSSKQLLWKVKYAH